MSEKTKKNSRSASKKRRGRKAVENKKLAEYKRKRRFAKTPEPAASRKGEGTPGPVYVIQRHRSSHLHYDLRLEEGGVLKSWALPKEPPRQEGVRRLAVATEDHPLGYEEFEGSIPEGEYGAGSVEVWDRGTYLTLEKEASLRVIDIRGSKLRGAFVLVKLKPHEPKDKNWLFFKKKIS